MLTQVIELGAKVDGISGAGKPMCSTPADRTQFGVIAVLILVCVTLGIVVNNNSDISKVLDEVEERAERTHLDTRSSMFTENYCLGAKPTDDAFNNFACEDAVAQEIEQAGAIVTEGYVGLIDNSATPPITTSYREAGLCPVNVHWHLGAEHLSAGQFDENGKGPHDDYELPTTNSYHRLSKDHRQLASGGVRLGYQCMYYDENDSKYTKPYDWQHCVNMMVGQTYEIHWPHSTVGACGTPYQYQTPFYDGVFCGLGSGAPILYQNVTTHDNVGVQSQVFTIVNDEDYYYPDLFKGAIYTGNSNTDFWSDVAIYTGSTTGTSRSNEVCSAYSPITWQVDRKCHLISASSFDKMCADMKAQVDDMSDDLYAHGAREVVSDNLAAAQET